MRRVFVPPALCAALLIISGTLFPQGRDGRYPSAKPYTRWWWFASRIDTADVRHQLDWLSQNGFGGVEIAWVYPMNGDSAEPRYAWLSPEWTRCVSWTKRYADRIGLGCDFTFGTLWPFGGSSVPPKDGTIFYGDTVSRKTMRLTWEHPARGRVINHLDHRAFGRYARRMGGALAPAMRGSPSGIFFDSWEVETRKLWTAGFDGAFRKRFGYDIRPLMDSLYRPGYEGVFYDYMSLISDLVLREFFRPFSAAARRLGGFSRAQCGGSPCDLLTAFSIVDVPETEAILYEPGFALIPASAAFLASRPIVSSETFTCMYGWKRWPGPSPFQKQEQVADMKLIADALFAHGVNQIFWHGMPFNPEGGTNTFYASVHVGPDSHFRTEIPAFNRYMTTVSRLMRRGTPWSDVAVYLPLEDAWMGVEYPDSLKFPWVWGEYELRYVKTPDLLRGRQPTWINHAFLKSATLRDGVLHSGDAHFTSLYIDAQYLDRGLLLSLIRLARRGFPICLIRDPIEPGRNRSADYALLVSRLRSFPRVVSDFRALSLPPPLVEGEDLPDFRCRKEKGAVTVFFAHPRAQGLKYPLLYGQSRMTGIVRREVRIRFGGVDRKITLAFEPYQSICLRISTSGDISLEDISYQPPEPHASGE